MRPGLVQHMLIKKLKALQVELNGTPGPGFQQIGEILEQLRFGQIIKLVIKILAESPNSPRISIYRLGLEPFELKVFEMRLIVLLEMGFR
jgi:hypothetical protein